VTVMRRPFVLRHPSVLVFLALLALFTLGVTILSEGMGLGLISTSFVKTLGKTLCLCLIAVAMDLVWGYCGILSLGHFAFFGLGGYMIGMWLMYERTKDIVIASLAGGELPATPEEIREKYLSLTTRLWREDAATRIWDMIVELGASPSLDDLFKEMAHAPLEAH